MQAVRTKWAKFRTKLNCGIKVCKILHPDWLCCFLWTGQNATRTVSVNQSTSGLKSFQLTFFEKKKNYTDPEVIAVTLLRTETQFLG